MLFLINFSISDIPKGYVLLIKVWWIDLFLDIAFPNEIKSFSFVQYKWKLLNIYPFGKAFIKFSKDFIHFRNGSILFEKVLFDLNKKLKKKTRRIF